VPTPDLIRVSFGDQLDGAALLTLYPDNCSTPPSACVQLAVTTDGGLSWQAEGGFLPLASTVLSDVGAIDWASPAFGYAWSSSDLLRIDDKGQWQRIQSPPGLVSPSIQSVSVLGDSLWVAFLCGGPTSQCTRPLWSWRSRSGWQPVSLPVQPAGSRPVEIVRPSDRTALLLSSISGTDQAGSLFESNDGGSTWTRLALPCGSLTRKGSNGTIHATATPDSVALVPGASGAPTSADLVLECVGAAGVGYQALSFWSRHSLSAGIWQLQSDNVPSDLPAVGVAPSMGYASDIVATPGSVWIALGRSPPYRSTDDGHTWEKPPELGTEVAHDVLKDSTLGPGIFDFINARDGWCLYWELWRTTDGGAVWTRMPG